MQSRYHFCQIHQSCRPSRSYFAVSLEGETNFFNVVDEFNLVNGLITIGDKYICK